MAPAGREPVEGADTGDAGTCYLRHHTGNGVRHPDGGLFGAEARQPACENIPGGVADRHLAADVLDRHPLDLSVLGDAGLAAVVRPRRSGAARLVDHPAIHTFRPPSPDDALDHPWPGPGDLDPSACA